MKVSLQSTLIMTLGCSIFFSLAAYSREGSETGNGGGAVVCRDAKTNAIKRVELLDFYEARELRRLKLDLGGPEISVESKVDKMLVKLAKLSPLRAKKYKSVYEKFFEEAVIIPDSELKYIDDAENVVVPVGCKKEQVSILMQPEFPNDPRYIVSKTLWDKMDNDSKAGLILHEIVYQEGLSISHENSKPTRFLVGFIASTKSNSLTPVQFNELILSIFFKAQEMFGTLVVQDDPSMHPGSIVGYTNDQTKFFESVLSNEVRFSDLVLFKKFTLELDQNILVGARGVAKISRKRVEVSSKLAMTVTFEDGKIRELKGLGAFTGRVDEWSFSLGGVEPQSDLELIFDDQEFPIAYRGVIQVSNPKTGYKSSKLIKEYSPAQEGRLFSLDGVVLRGELAEPSILMTPQGPLLFDSLTNSQNSLNEVVFDEKGIVKSGRMAPDQEIKTPHGVKKPLNYTTLKFQEDGLAVLEGHGQGMDQPDLEYGGCEITNYELALREAWTKGFDSYLGSSSVSFEKGSLLIKRLPNVLLEKNGYKSLHAAFEITFRTKNGSLISINSLADRKGLLLREEAALRTNRNREGQITGWTCEQGFVRDVDFGSDRFIFWNETLNREVKVDSLYVYEIAEEQKH